MKILHINLLSVLAITAMFSSCIKDKGNYDYDFGNEVTIRHPTYSYTAFIGDTARVYATRVFSNPADTTDFDHAWYINGEFYSDKPVLEYVGTAPGSVRGMYYMIDRKSKIQFPSLSAITINVTSPYQTGWGILYEKDGKSELAHIRVTGGSYFDYTDLYKKNNNNEEMGSQPVSMKEFTNRTGRGMFIAQHGGQESIELDAYSLQKKLVTKASFAGGTAPSDLKPVDMGFFATSDMLVNQNGDVYARFFNNPLPFTTPWLTIPMHVANGMKIRDIWKSWANSLTFIFMYDEQNHRILQTRLDAPNVTGGIAVTDTLPKPKADLPADHVDLNHMGEWIYVWGGTFNDAMYAATGAVLLRSPDDGQIYFQSFPYKSVNRVHEWTPGVHIPFTGSQYVTNNSVYTAIKSRDYLFFSGGANNDQLYYFDVKTGQPVTLYEQMPASITTITQSDNSNEIAVGLENGTVIIYDISNPVIISGVSKELHRLSGLGKVKDIIVKGGQMR